MAEIDLKINLNILVSKYQNKKAIRAKKTLLSLIQGREIFSLKELLRHHRDKPVLYFFELHYRKDIDELLSYYSVIEIAILCGYIPRNLTNSLNKELKIILGNEYVETYYKKHYPLLLIRALEDNIKGNLKFERKPTSDNEIYLFERFLFLIDDLEDDDINTFLWFLEDGSKKGYGIDDINEIFRNPDRLNYKLTTNKPHILNQAIWGFVKYIHFLEQYYDLLIDSREEKLLQSAFWHFQSYWFLGMKEKFDLTLKNALISIVENANEINYVNFDFINQDRIQIPNYEESILNINSIMKKISFLLNVELGTALEEFLLKNGGNFK